MTSPLTSISELQLSIGWQNVSEYKPMKGWRVFAVCPSEKLLPPIEFLFDENVTMLQQLGFGPWHGHYQKWSDERKNVRSAIATARVLVTGARCLLVERSASGAYLGSGIYRRSSLPLTLSRDFARLERLPFNASPEHVPVDLSRFYRTKIGTLIENAWRKRLKASYAGTTINSSMFD